MKIIIETVEWEPVAWMVERDGKRWELCEREDCARSEAGFWNERVSHDGKHTHTARVVPLYAAPPVEREGSREAAMEPGLETRIEAIVEDADREFGLCLLGWDDDLRTIIRKHLRAPGSGQETQPTIERARVRALVAQVEEAIAIMEDGTDYERLHVAAILRNGLEALAAPGSGSADSEGAP